MAARSDLGKRIRALRRKVGLTQAQLAEKLGLNTLTVWSWENGRRSPEIGRLNAIAEALNVPAPSLLDCAETVKEEAAAYAAERLPLYRAGHIASATAGEPVEIGRIGVSPEQAREADAALMIEGDSMEPDFRRGDIVLIRTQSEAQPGQLVLATVDGELTFKRFVGIVHDSAVLQPLNPTHDPIISRDVRILGVYRWLLRHSSSGKP